MKKLLLFAVITIATIKSHAQSWSLTGNSGTNSANFIGTKDANPFLIKVNNQRAGYIDYSGNQTTGFGYQCLGTKATANTAFGYKSITANTTGTDNTAIGAFTLLKNTTGGNNTATGAFALDSNTTGSGNTANGIAALSSNTSGDENTAAGSYSLYANSTGSNNTANGYYALSSNTTGSFNTASGLWSLTINSTGNYNTASGASSLALNSTGSYNTASGYTSLYGNTTGNYNTASGVQCLYKNSGGSDNTAGGYNAMYYNGTGSYNTAFGQACLFNNSIGSDNTAYGNAALYSNTTAGQNVAIGTGALYYQSFSNSNAQYSTNNTAVGFSALNSNQPSSSSNGNYNTAVGSSALFANTDGDKNTAIGGNALLNTASTQNTAIGYYAGASNNNGSDNCFLGGFTNTNANGLYGSTAVGLGATITAANQIRVGDQSIGSIGGYVGWSNISDGRVKKNIKQNVPGLAFINKLQPVTYNLDLDAADKIIQPAERKDKDGNAIKPLPAETDARKAKEQIIYTGFIAQDVEKAAKSLNYDFSGVDAAKNSKDLYALRYAEFVVPLVKAMQELSKKNDGKDSVIAQQQNQINDLETRLSNIESMMNVQHVTTYISSASLSQNIPNPFSSSTTINYNLPQNYSSANIIVTDAKGVVLKQINLNSKGKGNIQLDASTLASGAYRYSLYVNGKLIDSKQMISSK